MKISISIAAVTFIALAVLAAAGFYIYKNLNEPVNPADLPSVPLTINDGRTEIEETPEIKNEEVLKETTLLKDGFEITLPPGWLEATSTYEGFLLLAFDGKEDISGGNFQKLDFRTNISIKSDDLSKYSSLDTLEKYVESMKISLTQVVPSINFIQEEQKIINGSQVISVESSSRQEEADFKTLLVFIKNNNTIYAISFNTFQESWGKYRGVFEQTVQSFKLRYSI